MTKSLDWYKARPNYTDITGLSDVRRLPRKGKIRLGIRVKKPKADPRCKHDLKEMCGYCSFPKDVDYFVVPPEVQAVYGEKPKELDIFIPTEDKGMFFPASLKWYTGPRLMCRGDGKTALRLDPDKGTMKTIDCPCEHYGKDCFPRASLMVMLPSVTMAGVYQIDTGSTATIISLNSTIEYLQDFLIGRIAFIPLKLKREAQKLQTPEGKTVNKYLMKLEFVGNIEDVARLRSKDAIQQLVQGSPQPLALPPAAEDAPEDEDAIEFTGGPGSVLHTEKLTPPDVVPTSAETEEPFPQEAQEPEEAEPVVDVAKYVPYQEPPEIERPPEPKPETPKKNEYVEKIAQALHSSTSKTFLNAKWQEMVVNNKNLTGPQKVELQASYLEAMKKFKGQK